MNEIKYGFVDSNNTLMHIINFIKNDNESIERVKKELNIDTYYEMIEPYGPAVVENSLWTGEYFTPGKTYFSWIWNFDDKKWVPPIPYPEVEPNNPKEYFWNEDIVNWEEIQVSE